jgi:proteasome lid subunit RPN8/RPN11
MIAPGASPPITIPPDLRAALYDHATTTFPDECCGYLRGPASGATVDELVRCRNALAPAGGDGGSGSVPDLADRGPRDGFALDGPDLFAFARTLASPRPARILYHSHPTGRAYLSDLDRRLAAGPGGPVYPVQHLVLGVGAGGVAEVAQFGWDGAGFAELARWRP